MINIEEFKKYRADRHLIVLDTNIFLELYRQPANISLDVISALTKIIDNIYVPRQVYEEYLGNFQKICGGEKKKYQRVSKELAESVRKLQEDIDTKITEYRKHNYTDITKLQEELDEKISDIQGIVKEFEKNHKTEIEINIDFLKADKVKEFVDLLEAQGKIQASIPFSKRLSVLQEGKTRFDNLIPPEFMDIEKEGADKYGDLFVWKSIIEVAKEKNVNIIFVCNDTKEDWWEKDGDTPINLRRELLDEFKEQNPFLNVNFMTLDKFFSYLVEELHIGNSKSALQLSAIEDSEKLLEEYGNEIYEKIEECLLTTEIQNQIDGEFIETGDENIYWEIASVSVEKEDKNIIYYINLDISVIADLSFEEPESYPYSAGKEVIDISGKVIIKKEEYASTSNLEDIQTSMVGMQHIEPEVWEIIKNASKIDSAKKIIASNKSIEEYRTTISNLSEGLNIFAQVLEPYRTFANQSKGLHEVAKVMQPLSEITEQSKGVQEMVKPIQPLVGTVNQTHGLMEMTKVIQPLSGTINQTQGLTELAKTIQTFPENKG